MTAALATVSFLAQQYGGIAKYGVVDHFKNLVPPGMPLSLLPIMIPIEILGMFTQAVRAHDPALRQHAGRPHGDHRAAAADPADGAASARYLGIAMAPLALGLALFIMILEVLVAFIQAYIFTLLTSIFIGMYAHPAH